MSNNEQREQLARLTSSRHPTEAADAILAAGYRKPRTIETHEELDALDAMTVIHSAEGAVFEKCHSGWIETGRGGVMDSEDIILPATIIHEPTTEATQ